MTEVLGWPGFADVTMIALVALLAAAFVAGLMDSIVGGGGLIQLPVLLFFVPGGEPVYSLATNKIASVTGTSAAFLTYRRRTPIRWSTAGPMAATAFAGSFGGAWVADLLPSRVLWAVVLTALAAVGLYTLRRPGFGTAGDRGVPWRVALPLMIGGGAVLGFYDGVTGPGTGSFLIFFLVGAVGYEFLPASATAKLVNAGTNLGALAYFAPQGKVLWGLGLVMALANLAGAITGARIALRRGSAFVRRVFLVVIAALGVTLATRLALT